MRFTKIVAILLFTVVGFASCCGSRSIKTPQGVTIYINNTDASKPKLVRLEVVDHNIVRVMATPKSNFDKDSSLITVYDRQRIVPFLFSETDICATIKTDSLIVNISKQSGKVDFFDISGKALLAETEYNSKSFSPVTIDQTESYNIRQQFKTDIGEALYGLGQHQSEEFNYKGKSESLYQYNTKISIPFIVSNKNYGILWDNYSLTRFGNPSEPQNLNALKLYDKMGNEGALTATYYNKNSPDQTYVIRNESTIDYTDLDKIANFPQKLDFYSTAIKWEGYIEPNTTGIYDFSLYYAGYTKLYIDDELVVKERWRTAWNPNTYKFSSLLNKGEKREIRLEWIPDGGASYIGLSFLEPTADDERENISFWSEMGNKIDYYFIAGNNTDEVIKGYRYLTGKAQIMPKWAMGYWQSRERYKTQEELLTTVKEYRKRGIPLDNIVVDWFYWKEDDWGSHEFDLQRYPDAKGMVDQAHKMNVNVMISVWPKFYETTEHFKEFDKNGWMYRQAIDDRLKDWVGKGYVGSFYDAYNPEARKLFWEQIQQHLYTKGFDAWWMDASEPDILSNASLEYRKKLSSPTHLGSSSKYLNTYALMNAEAIYNGQRSVNPDKRVFLLTRSGFAGIQRYSTASWSGDIATRWEDMRSQLTAGLNFAISGIPYWTMDVGGFCVERRYEKAVEGSEDMEEWRELNARWHQFGAFCPLYRSHGQFPFREMYNIAPQNHPAYKSMVAVNKLRYKLMPYIYTLAGKTHFEDYTIMRPLVMDYNGDENIYNIHDQYMFGPYMLVCPITEYKARKRRVYLPKQSNWYDFASGMFIEGGQTITVDAPLNSIPIFISAGGIIPFGEEIQHTGELSHKSKLTVRVYTGADGRFDIYEDEGGNYNYEKGKYSLIPMIYSHSSKTLTIGNRVGEFSGMPSERIIEVEAISADKKTKGKTILYKGREVVINL